MPSPPIPSRPSAVRASADPLVLGARIHAREIDLACAGAPVDVFAHATVGGRREGAVLLESAEHQGTGGRASLVVPFPAVGLRIERTGVVLRALDPRALPLIRAVARRFDADATRGEELRLPLPERSDLDEATDRERLLAPSALDFVRALVGVVSVEEGPADALPIAVYGSFGFELVDVWEDLPPARIRRTEAEEPLANLALGLDGIRYDHVAAKAHVVTRALRGPGIDADEEDRAARERLEELCRTLEESRGAFRPARIASSASALPRASIRSTPTESEFLLGVDRLLEHVRAGDVFQCVLSRRFDVESAADPLAVYRELLVSNPSPYHFFLDTGDGVLLGASPEPAVEVYDRRIEVRPIAGTCPRGRTRDGSIDRDLDARLGVALTLDAKEQAEHAMLVDLARNDLARVSRPGTRELEGPPHIERYSHVQHLVSRVRAELDDGLDALHAYQACANMGTLTGAPKLRAMELVRELEPGPRGWYGGAVGCFDSRGNLTTAIAIRSIRYRNGTYSLQAGAGIVADSVPERELAETRHKADACLAAIAAAEGDLP